jgi:hypothetical protein
VTFSVTLRLQVVSGGALYLSFISENFEHEVGFTITFSLATIVSFIFYIVLDYFITLIIPLERCDTTIVSQEKEAGKKEKRAGY